eukprot:scaffold1220_cov259-Pinguiococcus_pyrenoidosus.AAC.85
MASSGEKARLLLLLHACITDLPPQQEADASAPSAAPGEQRDDDGAFTDPLGPPKVIFFDEIDAHVGGAAMQAVGQTLRRQAQNGQQVVIITHSAPLAALADRHFVVGRDLKLEGVSAGNTDATAASEEVCVVEVRGAHREQELARMATGQDRYARRDTPKPSPVLIPFACSGITLRPQG